MFGGSLAEAPFREHFTTIFDPLDQKFCFANCYEMVGARGFEPPTLWSQTRCATRLRHAPVCGSTVSAIEIQVSFSGKLLRLCAQLAPARLQHV